MGSPGRDGRVPCQPIFQSSQTHTAPKNSADAREFEEKLQQLLNMGISEVRVTME